MTKVVRAGLSANEIVDTSLQTTILHWAAECGDVDLMAELLNKGAHIDALVCCFGVDVADFLQDLEQRTPLHKSALKNRTGEATRLLAVYGAQLDTKDVFLNPTYC